MWSDMIGNIDRPDRPRPRLAPLHLDLARPVPLRRSSSSPPSPPPTSPAAPASSSSSSSSPLWGWWQWNRGRQQAQDGSIAVRFATWRERGYLRRRRRARHPRRRRPVHRLPVAVLGPRGRTRTSSSAPSSRCTPRRAAWSSSGSPGCWSTWSASRSTSPTASPSPASSTSSTAPSSCGACATGGCAPARPQPALEGAPA